MKGILHLYNEVFKVNYYVTFTKKYSTYQKLVSKVLNIEAVDKAKEVSGNTSVYESKRDTIIWIWISNKKYLVHESIHAGCYTLRAREIEISESSGEEVLCYLVDWLIKNTKGIKEI